ncbi:hypothetical protein ACI797_19190 [Geodermatophilus sp. SYSU D00691]
MTAIDRGHVAALLAAGDAATTTTERGRALEEVIVHVFGSVPGVVLSARNVLNAFHSEEIDVAFWNDCDPAGLRLFDHILLVECKNWRTAVGSDELMVFDRKLISRGRPMGIFVAAAGITGDPEKRLNAHRVLAEALAQNREIIVVTRREIEGLVDTDELVLLLKRKRAQLVASQTIFEVSAEAGRV